MRRVVNNKMTQWDILLWTLSQKYIAVYRGKRVEDDLLHSTFTQCFVHYIVGLQVGTELLIAWKSFDCRDVSLHEVFL